MLSHYKRGLRAFFIAIELLWDGAAQEMLRQRHFNSLARNSLAKVRVGRNHRLCVEVLIIAVLMLLS